MECFFLAAARWAGRCAERRVAWPWRKRRFSFFSVVLCWQNFKSCECLLAMPSFQCIGAAVCLPRCLAGRWPGGPLKGASPSLGGGTKSFFFVVLCWQNVKICEFLVAMPSFQCIGGASVPPPMPCRTLGPGGAPKAA